MKWENSEPGAEMGAAAAPAPIPADTGVPEIDPAQDKRAKLILVLLLIAVAVSVLYFVVRPKGADLAADKAITAAVEACRGTNHAAFSQSVTEARTTFQKLPAQDQPAYQQKLASQLKLSGCRFKY